LFHRTINPEARELEEGRNEKRGTVWKGTSLRHYQPTPESYLNRKPYREGGRSKKKQKSVRDQGECEI